MKRDLFFKKAGITCLFLCLFSAKTFSAQATCYLSAEQSEAYQSLLKMDFKKCIGSLTGKSPYHFQIKSLAYCLDAFVNCDKRKYQLGRRTSLKWQDSVSTYKECEEKRFAKALIKIHWAFLASSYNEKIAAAIELRQAFFLLKENQSLYPGHKPTLLYFGMLNAFIEDIPDNYKWIANSIGLKFSGHSGQSMISASKNCNPLLDMEMNALMLLRKPQSKQQEEILNKGCDFLMENYGNDDLIRFIVSFYYIKNKNTAEATIIERTMTHNSSAMQVYLKALTAYNNLEIDTSIFYFKKFNKLNKSESFKKDAALKIAYLFSLEGDSVQAKRYITSIKKIGNDAIYADKSAEKLAGQAIPKFLHLKSRILFDAGNWAETRRFLLLWKTLTVIDKTEYYYRLGKVEMELGDLTKSKNYFKNCISACPKQNVYYGPFACLNLAEVCFKENNLISARHYLGNSKNYSGFDYQQTFKSRFSELSKMIK